MKIDFDFDKYIGRIERNAFVWCYLYWWSILVLFFSFWLTRNSLQSYLWAPSFIIQLLFLIRINAHNNNLRHIHLLYLFSIFFSTCFDSFSVCIANFIWLAFNGITTFVFMIYLYCAAAFSSILQSKYRLFWQYVFWVSLLNLCIHSFYLFIYMAHHTTSIVSHSIETLHLIFSISSNDKGTHTNPNTFHYFIRIKMYLWLNLSKVLMKICEKFSSFGYMRATLNAMYAMQFASGVTEYKCELCILTRSF